MDRRSPHTPPFSLRPPTRRNLRWASGLVLMAYVTAHLLNHSLGIYSFAAAETVLRGVQKFWHSLPGTVLLYGAAAVHLALAVVALWERRTLRMPPLEGLRVLLGAQQQGLAGLHAVPQALLGQQVQAPIGKASEQCDLAQCKAGAGRGRFRFGHAGGRWGRAHYARVPLRTRSWTDVPPTPLFC